MPAKPPHPDLVRIGALLTKRRTEAGVTQGELAIAAGVSRASIANISCGRQNIPATTLLHVCSLLEIDVGELGETPSPRRHASDEVLVRATLAMGIKHLAEIEQAAAVQARLLREIADRLDPHH